jgi:hypothetical protein
MTSRRRCEDVRKEVEYSARVWIGARVHYRVITQYVTRKGIITTHVG